MACRILNFFNVNFVVNAIFMHWLSIPYICRAPCFGSICYLSFYLSSFLMVIYKYLNVATLLLVSCHCLWSRHLIIYLFLSNTWGCTLRSDWCFSEEGRKYLANTQWLKLYHYPRQNGRLFLFFLLPNTGKNIRYCCKWNHN